jgi:hypothetical protein
VNGYRVTCAAALVTAVLTCAAALPAFAEGSADESGISLQRGTQWMSVQAGYARGAGDIAPDGLFGGAFGYRRFVLDRWSVGGFVGCDLLGKFGGAADIDVPLVVEVARHTKWGAAVYPYFGFGVGAHYRKYYRTGEDVSEFTPGRHATVGVMTPIRKGGMLGLSLRMTSVARLDDNPVFPGPDPDRRTLDDYLKDLKGTTGGTMPLMYSNTESKNRLLWGIKLDYTLSY